MKKRATMVSLVLLFVASGAIAEDWVSVSTLDEIRTLRPEIDSVELLFRGGVDDHLLLSTLADRKPDLACLSLTSRGGADVRPLEPLERFEQLTHLEIHEGVSNFCWVDPATGARELDVVGRMTSLTTLVLDTY